MSGYFGRIVRTAPGFAPAVLLAVAVALAPAAVLGAGALSVEVVTAYNLVVDSNVTSPATYAPKAGYIGAKICNTGDAPLANVIASTRGLRPRDPGEFHAGHLPA